MIIRDLKRQLCAERYAEKRIELRKKIKSPHSSVSERMAAVSSLSLLPRDSNPNRQQRRCSITGRPRGTYRKFAIGRNKLREFVMQGDIPGITKASW